MKSPKPFPLGLSLLCVLTQCLQAAVVVDDKWVDGSRAEQKLPTKSAWFSSNPTNLIASPGKLTVWSGTNSRQFMTYFEPAGSPASLAKAGDTMTATLQFSPSEVTSENNSRNLRFGLFDSSEAKRMTADSTPSGNGFKGYAVFLNFGQTFGTPNALKINSRTNINNADLLGASVAYANIDSSGQPANHSRAFTNGGSYTFEFSVKRTGEKTMQIRTVITGGGLSITNTAEDKGVSGPICAKFDTFAIRSYSADMTAARFELTEFKVEGLGATAQASK
jgi:hypothetical protein